MLRIFKKEILLQQSFRLTKSIIENKSHVSARLNVLQSVGLYQQNQRLKNQIKNCFQKQNKNMKFYEHLKSKYRSQAEAELSKYL